MGKWGDNEDDGAEDDEDDGEDDEPCRQLHALLLARSESVRDGRPTPHGGLEAPNVYGEVAAGDGGDAAGRLALHVCGGCRRLEHGEEARGVDRLWRTTRQTNHGSSFSVDDRFGESVLLRFWGESDLAQRTGS